MIYISKWDDPRSIGGKEMVYLCENYPNSVVTATLPKGSTYYTKLRFRASIKLYGECILTDGVNTIWYR